MPTPVPGPPREGAAAAKEPVIRDANPAHPGETVVEVTPSVSQGESTIKDAPVLGGTYSPVEVAPHPAPDDGVNSGFGPKNDNYDDHPGFGIDGLV